MHPRTVGADRFSCVASRAAAAGALLLAPAAVAVGGVGLLRSAASAWSSLRSAPLATPDGVLEAMAVTALALAAGWLAVALGAEAFEAVSAARTVRRVHTGRPRRAGAAPRPTGVPMPLPTPVRAAVAWLAAVAVVGATASAGVAGTSGTRTSAATPAAGAALDPGWPAATGPPSATRPSAAVRPPAGQVVVVRRGDTLWHLAEVQLGDAATPGRVARQWPRWYAANRSVIGPDPDHIEPGQRLRRPGRADGAAPSGTTASRPAPMPPTPSPLDIGGRP